MNNTELKPCPFCGGKLEFIFLINIFKCRQCSARIEFPICKTDEERIKKVNTASLWSGLWSSWKKEMNCIKE